MGDTLLTSLDIIFPSSLHILKVYDSQITSIEHVSFVSLPSSLQDLYLDNNPITSIATDAFSHLTQLRKLDLSRTHLTSINIYIPPSLHQLYLANNPISTIPLFPM